MQTPIQQYNNQTYLSKLRPSEDDIIKSKIIARATVRHSHGEFVTIICAFQLSYAYQFWFAFRARSPRTPRKYWRYTSKSGVHGYRDEKVSLATMIDRTIREDTTAKVTKRYPAGKRNFDSNFDRVCYPFKNQLKSPPAPISTEYINRKFLAGRRGYATVGR